MRPYVGSVKMIEPSRATITSFGLFSSLSPPVRRERLARPVGRLADDGARDVLADDQVAVVVERHAVALVARVAQDGDALVGVPAAALVARACR